MNAEWRDWIHCPECKAQLDSEDMEYQSRTYYLTCPDCGKEGRMSFT